MSLGATIGDGRPGHERFLSLIASAPITDSLRGNRPDRQHAIHDHHDGKQQYQACPDARDPSAGFGGERQREHDRRPASTATRIRPAVRLGTKEPRSASSAATVKSKTRSASIHRPLVSADRPHLGP